MSQPQSNQIDYNDDKMIPYQVWGKDHWSTLAYVEYVCVECGGFEVGADSRMRTNSHNFRVHAQQNPKPKRPGGFAQGTVMKPEQGSRLNNGQVVVDHDDWGCVQDFVPYGLFTVARTHAMNHNQVLQLSEKGRAVAADLRRHKAAGGTFADYVPEPAIMTDACKE